MQLLLATKNLGKILEIRSILKPLFKGLDLPSLLDYTSYQAPEETGLSFQEISQHKAVHAAKALQIHALADDSGLVVPALNSEPGIKSARYSGPNATDKENRKKLIARLNEINPSERDGHYVASITLANPDGVIKCVEGMCQGHLLTEERGSQGFGYDSLFMKHDYSKTYAELSQEIKNKISHRAKAIDKLIHTLIVLSESKFALSH